MSPRSPEARIEQIEKECKKRSIHSPDCICFPEGARPPFHWDLEMQVAASVKCPLHGERFKPFFLIYVSKWLREMRERWLLRQNAQFRKAWYASFPPELWPGEERRDEDGKIFLILKDGTELLVYDPPYKPCPELRKYRLAYMKRS